MGESVNKKLFLIAENLACISFIFNMICVITAERGGAGSSAWITNFGVVYWFKTLLAVTGLFCFFGSRIFVSKLAPIYVTISTLIILLYSIPIINMSLTIIIGVLFKILQSKVVSLEYEDRLIIQTIWLIPVFIVIKDIFSGMIKVNKK